MHVDMGFIKIRNHPLDLNNKYAETILTSATVQTIDTIVDIIQ